MKDSGVIGLLHFFSRWLLWAITLPSKLLLAAALRSINLYRISSIYHFFFSFFQGWSVRVYQLQCFVQAVYKYYHPDGALTLQHFIIFFGAFELFLSQFPDIHSLRWVNAVCTFSTIGFAGTTIGVTIYNGELEMNFLIVFPFHHVPS